MLRCDAELGGLYPGALRCDAELAGLYPGALRCDAELAGLYPGALHCDAELAGLYPVCVALCCRVGRASPCWCCVVLQGCQGFALLVLRCAAGLAGLYPWGVALCCRGRPELRGLRERSIREVLHLWQLAGGLVEQELVRQGLIHSQPPVLTLPRYGHCQVSCSSKNGHRRVS